MQRQGLEVTIEELENLIVELKQEKEEFEELLGHSIANQKFCVPIINDKGWSDTWQIVK